MFVFLLLIPENQRENVNCHLSKEERKEISVDRERFIFIKLYSYYRLILYQRAYI